MPNYCCNTLTVYSTDKELLNEFFKDNRLTKDDILRIKEECLKLVSDIKNDLYSIPAHETLLSYNKALPMPYELMVTSSPNKKNKIKLIKKYGYEDWYSFAQDKWGVKWDTSECSIKKTSDKLIYNFTSPWNPPNKWMDFISKKYNKLNFILKTVYEESDTFPTYEIYKKGKKIEFKIPDLDKMAEELIM